MTIRPKANAKSLPNRKTVDLPSGGDTLEIWNIRIISLQKHTCFEKVTPFNYGHLVIFLVSKEIYVQFQGCKITGSRRRKVNATVFQISFKGTTLQTKIYGKQTSSKWRYRYQPSYKLYVLIITSLMTEIRLTIGWDVPPPTVDGWNPAPVEVGSFSHYL